MAQCFGLVSAMPTLSSAQIELVTLYNPLARQMPNFRLCQVSGIVVNYWRSRLTPHPFMLVRWRHKCYHSSSVVFLFSSGATLRSAVPDVSQPHIGGFVRRPDTPTEISLPEVPNKEVEL